MTTTKQRERESEKKRKTRNQPKQERYPKKIIQTHLFAHTQMHTATETNRIEGKERANPKNQAKKHQFVIEKFQKFNFQPKHTNTHTRTPTNQPQSFFCK